MVGRAQLLELPYRYGARTLALAEFRYEQRLLMPSKRLAAEVLTHFPESPAADRAAMLRAAAERSSGNFLLADAELQVFIKSRKNSPLLAAAHYERGLMAYEQGKSDESVVRFQEAASAAGQGFSARRDSIYYLLGADASFWAAVSTSKTGRHDDAIPMFVAAAEQYPHARYADDALFAAGQLHDIARRPAAAAAMYRLIRERYPRRNTALAAAVREADNQLLLRSPQAVLGLLEEAEYIQKAAGNRSDTARTTYETQDYAEHAVEETGYLRGEALNAAGQFDRAVAAFDGVLAQLPTTYLLLPVKLGRGWALLNLGQYQEAEAAYRQVIDSAADAADARAVALLYHAVAMKNLGNREQALKEFSALGLQHGYPYMAQALLETGQIHYEDARYDQARKTLERAERESSDATTSTRILLLLGLAYMETEQNPKAIKAFASAEKLAKSGNDATMPLRTQYLTEARLYQGIALAGNSQYREAVAKLGMFISEYPADVRRDEALFWIAESSYRAELFKNAEDFYREMLEQSPQSKRVEEATYGLAWTLFRQSEFAKSGAIFAELVKKFPQTRFAADAMARKGDGHFIQKQFRDAAEAYRQAVKFNPKSEEGQYAAYQLGYAHFREGDLNNAAEAFRSFVRSYPRSKFAPAALYSLGWSHFQQKNFTEAITTFNNLIQAYPGHELLARAHYSIGDCHYNTGEFERAAAAYRVVAMSFPASPYAGEAVKSMQFCLEALGRDDEADAVVEEYARNNPTLEITKELITAKAQKFYSAGRFANAVSELENYLAKYPENDKNAEALFYLGKSYIGMNEPVKAERALNDVRVKFPNSEFAPLGQLEIAYLKLQNNLAGAADSVFNIVQMDYAASQQAAQAGFERADIAFKLGDTAKALALYTDVAARYRSTEYGDQSLYRTAMFYRVNNQFVQAREAFTELGTRSPNAMIAAEAWYRTGELWLREKHYDSAAAAFVRVREQYSEVEDWFTLSMIGAGECYERLLNIEAARTAYQTIVALRPNDDYGKTAAARLKKLPKETEKKP